MAQQTAKEKAAELVEKFLPVALNHEFGKTESQAQLDNAKQCALIAVEEVIQIEKHNIASNLLIHGDRLEFWQQVKQELNGK